MNVLVEAIPLLVLLSLIAQPAAAFGVGDGLAIAVFLIIGVIALCALLGYIARRRAGR